MQDRLQFGRDLSFLLDVNSCLSNGAQALVVICFHWCWAVHLQGRWEAREEQPPALLPRAALPCTALLTRLLVCQPCPWLCGAASFPSLGGKRLGNQQAWCRHLVWGLCSAKGYQSLG